MRGVQGVWLTGFSILLGAAETAPAVVLADATSIPSLTCVSVAETTPPIAAPVDYACDRLWFGSGDASGPSRAFASSGFEDPLTVSVRVETTDAPFQISTNASSRIKFQLAVTQIAPPPANVSTVPVLLSTAGRVVVAPLAGLLAAGGTYLSSTESTIFTSADVFAYTMRTTSPSVETDAYDIAQTLDLVPDQVYFGNLYVGCNFSIAGTSACDGNAEASFHLDQAAFDLQMGANRFDLSQYFAVQRSPNLVPEPGSALLGLAAFGALAGCTPARNASMPRSRVG